MPNAGDFGFSIAGQLPGSGERHVERYRKRDIVKDDEGYTVRRGLHVDGYYDTLREAREAVDEEEVYFASPDYRRAMGIPDQDDTPALERPWWETER